MSDEFEIELYTSYNITEEVTQEMANLYWSDFVDKDLRDENPQFYSKERFCERVLDIYRKSPGFQTLICRRDTELVAFLTAAHLHEKSNWWIDVEPPHPEDRALEDGKTTIALFDMLVAKGERGNGLSRKLHERALANTSAVRATLLSSEVQQPAYSIWLHFGYEIVAHKQMDNGPQLDVFLRPI